MGVPWMTAERFYANTVSQNECLIWQGKGRIGPYGVSGFAGKHWLAHRLSYFFATGESPEVVRHSCDTPLCVEPTHLLGGSTQDNVDDKVSKRRHRFKESHPLHKLSQLEVDNIRTLVEGGVMQKDVAAQFDISRSQVSRIVLHQRW